MKVEGDEEYPVLGILQTVLSFLYLAVAVAYMIPFLICFIKLSNKPFLKMRSAYLALISGCSICLYIILVTLPRIISPGYSPFSTYQIELICSLRRFDIDLLNFLIAVPYLIRAARVYVLKKQVEGLINQRSSYLRKSFVQQKVLAFMLLSFSVILFAYAIVDIITAKFSTVWSPSDLFHSCIVTDNCTHNNTASWIVFAFLFLIYEALLVFFIIHLRGIKERINIFFELYFFAIAWFVLNIMICIQFVLSNTPVVNSLGHFVNGAIMIAIFTVSVTIQIRGHRKYNLIEDCSQLLREFPECLHFWVCNFYFHQYLQAEWPRYVPLRPLIADIMRYEFAADDTSKSFSLQTQRSRAIDIYLKYLSPEGPHYFDFSRYGDLQDDFERRFDDLDNNLNEFLFEFVSTQVVEILTPVYNEFCQTLYFKRMELQSTRDEIFANVLQY